MKFRRLRTDKAYHDSIITAMNWCSETNLEISIRLDTHWNKSGAETATLLFMNAKNRSQIEDALNQIAQNRSHHRWVAEIVAFARHGKTSFVLDTSPQPSLIIDCASYAEI